MCQQWPINICHYRQTTVCTIIGIKWAIEIVPKMAYKHICTVVMPGPQLLQCLTQDALSACLPHCAFYVGPGTSVPRCTSAYVLHLLHCTAGFESFSSQLRYSKKKYSKGKK